MEKTNFKKWGWWAIGGLIIIAIAGAVIAANTTSEPTGSDDTNTSEEGIADNDSGEKTENKEEDVVAQGEVEELPQSGPDDSLWAIFLAGIFGYLISLGITTAYRAKTGEQEV